MLRITICALALTCSLSVAQESRVLENDWALMRIEGVEVGFLHTLVTERTVDGIKLIETAVDSQLTINRLGTTVSLKQSSKSLERPDGSLVRITGSTDMSNQVTETVIEFEGDEMRVKTKLMGRERERVLETDPEAIGPYRLTKLLSAHGLEAGTKWDAATVGADFPTGSDVYVEVIGPETVQVHGKARTLTKTETELDALSTTVIAWVDESGKPIKSLIPVGGLRIETILTTQKLAQRALGNGNLSPDIFEKTTIVASEFLPFTRRADTATLTVRPKPGSPNVEIPSSTRQVVDEANSNGSRRVRMRRRAPPSGRTGRRPLADVPAPIASSLASNTMIQCDEVEIRAIANKLVSDEPDAWKAACALERWVRDNVTEKSFDVGFASALEVCRDRSGDCSEHAVFLAALCRAAGIPARVAMGVMYIGGLWGGHAWNEVWIDGEWYALDATLGFGSVDPFHLTFGTMTLDEGEMASEFGDLIRTLGNCEIRVEELDFGGSTIHIRDGINIESGSYTNRLWGFALNAPEGFEVEPNQPSAKLGFSLLELEGKNCNGTACKIDVQVFDTPSPMVWSSVAGRYDRNADNVVTAEVDGRPARLLNTSRGGRNSRYAIVHADAALFVFRWNRVGGEGDDKTFADFLATVDFDVARN